MKKTIVLLFVVSFLCNGCSHSFSLYIRNFYEVPIAFNFNELNTLVPMYNERIEVAHKIVKINRNTYKQFTDSIILNNLDTKIILPAHSTNKIGRSFIGASLHPYTNRKNAHIQVEVGDSTKAVKLDQVKRKNKYQYYLDIKP